MSHPIFKKITLCAAALFALWFAGKFLIPLVFPFLLGFLVALSAEPLVSLLHNSLKMRRGFATALGVTTALLITVGLVLSLCALLIRELGALAGVLPDLEDAAGNGLHALQFWLTDLAHKAPAPVSPLLSQGVESIFSGSSTLVDSLTEKALTLASGILKGVPDSALGLGTWILSSFMISARLPQIRSWVSGHLPAVWHTTWLPRLKALKQSLWGWLFAQAKLVCITLGILIAGFLLLRIPHPLLWAGVICLVDILPILGTGTVLIPWSLVCFLQGDSLRAVGLLAIYTIVSLLRSVLEPRFVGKQLGLDPLVTLLALYAGYRIWGVPGMLLAPILAVAVTQMVPKPKKQD